MAEITFKIKHGSQSSLDSYPYTEGVIYFTKDTNNLYVDMDNKRNQINSHLANALKATINGETKEITINELVLKENVYNKTEIDTKFDKNFARAFEHIITVDSWHQENDEFVSFYFNDELNCGRGGNVPPIITYETNQEEYSMIRAAVASVTIEEGEIDYGKGNIVSSGKHKTGQIAFYSPTKPQNDIKIIIIDRGEYDIDSIPDNGLVDEIIDGLTITSVDIPYGYVQGGKVQLDNSIENELRKV